MVDFCNLYLYDDCWKFEKYKIMIMNYFDYFLKFWALMYDHMLNLILVFLAYIGELTPFTIGVFAWTHVPEHKYIVYSIPRYMGSIPT
jgi:hypothetical protein